MIVSTFWEQIKSVVSRLKAERKQPEPNWIDDIADDVVRRKSQLMEIVANWDNLRELCDEAGLDAAVEELNHIWPLLIDGGVENVEIS